jgi:hypothetical protein
VLLEFLLPEPYRICRLVKDQCATTGGALVDREDIVAHESSLNLPWPLQLQFHRVTEMTI